MSSRMASVAQHHWHAVEALDADPWLRQLPNAHLMKYEDRFGSGSDSGNSASAPKSDKHIEVARSPTVWEQTLGIIARPYN